MAKAKPKPKPKAKPRKKNKAFDRDNYHLPVRSEAEQFEGLSDDLQDTWRKLRRFLIGLGLQEDVRTSHRSIMFARKTCYAFVRPKKSFLELNFFLPRAVESELLAKVDSVSKTKWVHVAKLTHEDQVEEPLTDWVREAYEVSAG